MAAYDNTDKAPITITEMLDWHRNAADFAVTVVGEHRRGWRCEPAAWGRVCDLVTPVGSSVYWYTLEEVLRFLEGCHIRQIYEVVAD